MQLLSLRLEMDPTYRRQSMPEISASLRSMLRPWRSSVALTIQRLARVRALFGKRLVLFEPVRTRPVPAAIWSVGVYGRAAREL
jgi:hypothetical protein